MAKKPLWLDGVVGSQIRDTQGEILSIEGADISELATGKGRWNDNHGKGFFNSVGRITEAKKILKSEDCDNDRQRYFWDKVKAPFIYAKGYLYDDEDHPNAKAAAAILRNIHKSDSPLQLKASVEGGVVARGISDSSLLARTKIHSIALTFTPANNNTLIEPLSLDKSQIDERADMLLIQSVMHLAEKNVPSFRHIVRDASANKIHLNLNKISKLTEELDLDNKLSMLSKQDILKKALEDKIYRNVIQINELVLNQGSEIEEVNKGIKQAIAGATLATGLAAAPISQDKLTHQSSNVKIHDSEMHTDLSRMPASHQEAYRKIAQESPILGAIGFQESSGGHNYKHKTISNPESMHFGHTAGGMFGMMPHSVASILKSDNDIATKYPELAEASKDVNKNHKTITSMLNSNPQMAIDLATSYINKNAAKTKNLEMLLHSWNHGLKGTWKKYHKGGMDAIRNDEYVRKAVDHINKSINNSNSSYVLKALTAGYGSGSPTSATGGSVLQTESLDDGRVSFKYINCDKCGKEQVYAKHQVRCRDCGSAFSLEKLYNVMSKK